MKVRVSHFTRNIQVTTVTKPQPTVAHKRIWETPEDYEKEVERIGIDLQSQLYAAFAAGSYQNDVKLPRVIIPKFHGDYFKWAPFRDLFSTNLSNGQKMQLLKTLVDGEAAALISDLTVADVNFNSAWNRLLERYDNNRIVVYKHLNKLIT